MSLMPVMCGKRRGCTWCAASILTTWLTVSGMCSSATELPPAIQMTAMTITTMPGSTVPIRNPLLVMPDMAEVPRSVTSVAHQYMAIEKSPTKSPFCARPGIPII